MNKKLAIVLIAIVGIGLYALPSTVALFAGQHTFENIDATGNQIDCIKCHGDVNTELQTGLIGTNAPHAAFACELCHRVEAGKASGDNAYSAIIYTAVSPTDATITVRKTLIVRDGDTESENVPVSLLASATSIAAGTVLMSGENIGDLAGYKYKLSACYKSIKNAGGGVLGEAPPVVAEVPCNAAELALTLLPPGSKEFQTTSLYNTDGTPKDQTSTTRYGMFDASKVTYSWVGTQSTRSPYGWTFAQTPSFNGAGSEVSNPGTSYHAASLVSCLECHGGEAPTGHHDGQYADCNACHYQGGANKGGLAGIFAGGFGLGVSPGDTGLTEAHTEFVKTPDGLSRQRTSIGGVNANNGACIACHTHVAVELVYKKPTTYSAYIDMTGDAVEDITAQAAKGEREVTSGGVAP